jgi:hypothetical protein
MHGKLDFITLGIERVIASLLCGSAFALTKK